MLHFFDLDDAFGSVYGKLIRHSLSRLKFRPDISDYIQNLYSNLEGRDVTSDMSEWESTNVRFQKGLFQRDPMSSIIFLSVILLFWKKKKKLQQNKSFGCPINDTMYITTPFADDFNLIITNKRTHRRLQNEISTWTKSMNILKIETSEMQITISCELKTHFYF